MSEFIIASAYHSPAGDLVLGACGERLCLCDWAAEGRRETINARLCRRLGAKIVPGRSATIDEAVSQLDEYFEGLRTEFSIPLLLAGTEFQRRAWAQLLQIPYGEVITYARQALLTGNPKAVRAVASANANNPISIFVPCHRVIGSDNRLTGYAGGLQTKLWLLQHEARVSGKNLRK
ncbi:MAG: methylated-DNA--[protein]-cysteine S-methyltransferase [Clostridium sp.]|nr:methylated-DNA--[protein]-cysteine S-methyltransferase [Clostridium sp.]